MWIRTIHTGIFALLISCTDRAADEPMLTESTSSILEYSYHDILVATLQDDQTSRLAPYSELISPHNLTLELPADPVRDLINATSALSELLGFSQDTTTPIMNAELDAITAGRIANAVTALHQCIVVTNTALEGHDTAALFSSEVLQQSRFVDLPNCATTLAQAARDLKDAFEGGPLFWNSVGPTNLSIWPVLFVDLAGNDDIYDNDFLLIVDAGGKDTYNNNAGSNVIDINYAPTSSPVPGRRGYGPSAGCQQAITGLTGLLPNEQAIRDPDCIAAAALLLDISGNDTYGVPEVPSRFRRPPDVDWVCTNETIIRRMLTNGVGFAGVGILLDAAGDDLYRGKTVSNGAGHLGGVGLLLDEGGNDNYESVRNSQGFGLFGGFGLLADRDGQDNYSYHMPSGGVLDDEDATEGGPFCDATPRFVQGVADYTGIGLLLDGSGQDSYHGSYRTDFDSPLPVAGRAGSQGFGNNGGFGALIDYSGSDHYFIDGIAPPPARRNGTLAISPTTIEMPFVIRPDPTCMNSSCLGLFVDLSVTVRPGT